MTICGAITNAVGDISTSGIVQSLGQVLGVLGAADVAIRLGSGGQAGALDLPSLLSETAGIPCFSPELGDFIYVTPLQFWANGGKCAGLRDPDRERLQHQIEMMELEMAARNAIRNNMNSPTIPPGWMVPGIENALFPTHGGFGGGSGIEFLAPGKLVLEKRTDQCYTMSDYWPKTPIPQYYYGNEPEVEVEQGKRILQKKSTDPGDKLKVNTEIRSWVSPTYFPWTPEIAYQTFVLQVYENGRLEDARGVNKGGIHTSNYRTIEISQGLGLYNRQPFSAVKYNLSTQPTAYRFEPSSPPPPNLTSNGQTHSIPINPPPTPELPEETPCMGGCSCRDIAGAQQQRLNNLEKLVKEIHKAVAAQNFISTYTFAPEQQIENAGKKIYQSGFGRAGTIQANNLFEAINGLVASEYYRLGLHRFPAKVPDSLIPNPNALAEAVDRDVIDISDLAGFQEWWFKQWNAWSGKWPIEFEVTDDGKKKPVKLWNLEHAIAELYAGNLKIIEDADQGVQWGIRAATEASKSGNAALKALHILNELVKLTGAITGNETIKVKTTFTPNLDSWQGAGQTTEEMLKSSEQDLIVTDIKDNRTLIGLLLNISYWVQIAGKAVYGSVDTNPATGQPGMPGDAIKAERKKDKQRNSQFEKEWDKWKREVQLPNNNGILTPDAVNPPTPNITEVQKPNI